MAEARLEQLISRLEQATSRLEKVSIGGKGGASASGAAEEVAASVTGWDEYIQASVQPFLDISKKIGGDLNQVADAVKDAFEENRKIVVIASLAKKPSEQELIALIKPLFGKVEGLQALRSKLRGDFADHVAGVAEGLKCLEWVGVNGVTVSHIKEMVAAAQFYTNKVLMKYRKTDQTHVDWVNALKKLIEDLAAYVKEYHTTGLTFNPKGKTVAEAQSGASSAPKPPAPAGGAPLPPPPPPAIDIPAPAPAASTGNAGGMDAVFEAIKTGNITSGLKKVTKEMKSKNNPNKSSIVTEVGSKKATTTFKKAEEKIGTPRIELVENKWVIEYQVGNKEIVLDNVQLKHSVYIYGCKDSLIQIKGKVNNVALDKCTKTGVIHEAVVASVELVNCKSIQIQCNDAVPTVAVDKTDGVLIYLTEKSLGAQIITSKSSEMNVSVPAGEDDQEEIPLPEQFITTYDPKTKKLNTTHVSHF